MAVKLLLADRVEIAQGDPRLELEAPSDTLSFGNRLSCDRAEGEESLRHRWGSTKLYRGYFQDYQTFLARPEYVADRLMPGH